MNYLQLCNAVLKELNEVEITTIASTRGIQSAVKDFINKAQKDIINSELEWPFTYSSATVTTASGTGEYALAADLKTIDQDTVHINLGGTKSLLPLEYLAYDEYIRDYLSLNSDPNDNHLAEPSAFYITQDLKLGLYPEPNGVYTVSYQYWSTHSDMASNTDVPVIPDRFHDIIVNRAKYYAYLLRSDLQSAQFADKDYRDGVTRMRVELINRKDYMRAV